MSADVSLERAEPTPEPGPAPSGIDARDRPWALSWHGVRTVAVLDLRQRVRSTRWIVALVVWFVAIGAITGLTWAAANATFGAPAIGESAGGFAPAVAVGPTLFGVVVFFVLFLGLLVAPTLSATSINGDRAAGTLATLQVTLLTPAEIAVGKLVAAWTAALAFLAASVPFLVLALAAGGTPVVSMLVCLLVLAVLLAVVCAIGLGFSALSARTSGSAVLTYTAVAGLAVLSPMIFGLTVPAVTTADQVRVWTVPRDLLGRSDGEAGTSPQCEWQTETITQPHTERTWWLLAINPFVIVADAAPQADAGGVGALSVDPLGAIRTLVRQARTGPAAEQDWCTPTLAQLTDDAPTSPVVEPSPDRSALWPWGLAANVLLGAAGLALTIRRLTIPNSRLPRGTRVA